MAVTRVAQFTLDLGAMVQARLESFVNMRESIQGKNEANFQRKVMEEGMSYQDQADYRQKQIAKEKGEKYPDTGFLEELKNSLSNLKQLSRYEKLRKDYSDGYTQYKEGKLSIDSLTDNLKGLIAKENDPTLKTELEKNLSNIKIEKVNSERQALVNRITLAQKDKSIILIDKALAEITTKRSSAYLVNDMEMVSYYDVQAQSLESQKLDIQTQDKLHDFDLKITKSGGTAMQKLSLLESSINVADKITPITIDNIQYASEYEYWSGLKERYISGNGGGVFVDFLGEFSAEKKVAIDTLSATNDYGYVPMSFLTSMDNEYKNLLSRPDFEIYASRVDSARIENLSLGVDRVAKAVLADAVIDMDFEKGETALKNIQEKFGLSTASYASDLYYQKLQIPSVVEAQSATAKTLSEIKGTTPEKEYEQFTKSPVESPSITKGTITIPALEKQKVGLEKRKADLEKQLAEKQKTGQTSDPSVKAPGQQVLPVTHSVKGGETLWGIAQQYGYKPTSEIQVMEWAKQWGYKGEAKSLPVGFNLNITPQK